MPSSAKRSVKLVDDASGLMSFLDSIELSKYNKPKALFVDLEGVKLSRNGSISIMSIYIPEQKTTYLVDIHRLGATAFTTCNSSDRSLKDVLEDKGQTKVIFDVSNDSDALFTHFKVSMAGVQDLQLMELACRRGSKAFVSGLAKCVEKDSGMTSAQRALWQQKKEKGMRLFAPERGGRYEVFNERPMRPDIIGYCAQDVVIMKRLYDVYHPKISAFWHGQVEMATVARIQESKSPRYDPHSREKARGPWSDFHGTSSKRTAVWTEHEDFDDFDWNDWEHDYSGGHADHDFADHFSD